MTKEKYIEEIKLNKRTKRKFDDYLNYFILIFPLGITFVGLSITFSYFEHKLDFGQLMISIFLISIGCFFLYFTLKRLNENVAFESIQNENNLALDELKTEIENNFNTNNIYIDKEIGLIEIQTKLSGFSWGETITIIKDGDVFLVNSKPIGAKQPVTIYKDRKNINKIKKILNKKMPFIK